MAKSSFDINRAKTHILMKEKGLSNIVSENTGVYEGSDEVWDFDKWLSNFRIQIMQYNSAEMEFDLIGIHTPIVNAFRRILLSDVPSMAIEKVLVYNNTTIMQDEVLAHRLGLIPLKADFRQFEFRQPDDEGSEVDTLKYELKIKCSWDRSLPDTLPAPERQKNTKVFSSHIKWKPIGSQGTIYTSRDVGPVHDDILICKMVPGQELDLELLAVKGIGRDHAKFSPVATASYRLLPEITLTRDVEGQEAVTLQKCFSPGVIKLQETKTGAIRAVVCNPRLDMCSRNVFRHEELKDAVRLERVKHHFIFKIESVGALPPDVLFVESLRSLKKDCQDLILELKGMREGSGKKKKA